MKTPFLFALAALVILTLVGCSSAAPASPKIVKGFSVYLTDANIKPQQLPILSHLQLESEPILTDQDIVTYTKATHEIVLTASAASRIQKLQVPTSGRAFAVCVDSQPIYAGAFWVSFSSQSYDGVVIDPLLVTEEHPILQIRLGYPGPGGFLREDPRADPQVLKALEQAGKLK
jgi:hypothetical protein